VLLFFYIQRLWWTKMFSNFSPCTRRCLW